MAREILFKAKRADTKEWVEGYIVRVHHRNEKGEIESYFFNALDELGWSYECVVSAETVCQYTGLNDSTKWEELSEEEKEKFLSERNHKEDRMNAKEDWSGRKIFEGDLIQKRVNVYKIGETAPCGERMLTGNVIWDDSSLLYPGHWSLESKDKHGNNATYIFDNEYKVIGNIFDNPELLNQ